MTEYASNSHKSKESKDEKRVKKAVVHAEQTKKSELRKFTDVFFQEDVNTVFDYIVTDVFVPALKTLISDVFKNGIDAVLYGKNGVGQTPSASRISYRQFYDKNDNRRPNATHVRSVRNYNDVPLKSRGDAELVLEGMYEILSRYPMVRVGDYYDLCDVTGDWTSNDYGWYDLTGVKPVRMLDGKYTLSLPPAVPLKE